MFVDTSSFVPSAPYSTSHFNRQKPEAKARLKRIEEDIRQSHMREKLAEARNQVIERNKKMVVVMQSWMGLSLFEAFDGWRFAVEKVHSQRRREERHRLKEERLAYESALSLYEYQVIEVSLIL